MNHAKPAANAQEDEPSFFDKERERLITQIASVSRAAHFSGFTSLSLVNLAELAANLRASKTFSLRAMS